MITLLHISMQNMGSMKFGYKFIQVLWKENFQKGLYVMFWNGMSYTKEELVEDWELCRKQEMPNPIEPLE